MIAAAVSSDPSHPSGSSIEAGYAARVRALNDACRKYPAVGHKLMLSRGVALLGYEAIRLIMAQVRAFDAFTEVNDPWHEHDFGVVEHNGDRIFWKIDCFDTRCEAASPDASDPRVTCRVLTVMLASEY